MPPPNLMPHSSLLKATTAVTAAFPFRPSLLRRSIVTPSNNPETLICLRTSPAKISIERRRRTTTWMMITPKSWAHTTFAMASSSSSSSSSSSLHQCQSGIDGSYNDKKEKKKQEEDGKSSKLLTLPTVLTLGRVAAVPLLVATFNMNGWWATTATTSIFLGAAVTDWLDGYLARKMNLGTAFGAFLDPVADKLMVAATLILLCSRPLEVAVFGEIPWILTVPAIVIIGREITMSAVREWAASQSSKVLEAVAVNNLGKWKTATQMTALTILLATRDQSLTGQGVLVSSGVGLLYISALLALWSLVVYMRSIWRVLLK